MDTTHPPEKRFFADFYIKERTLIKRLVQTSLLSPFYDSAQQVLASLTNHTLDANTFEAQKRQFKDFTTSHQISYIVDAIPNETIDFFYSVDPNQSSTSPNSNQTSKWFRYETMCGVMSAFHLPENEIGKQWTDKKQAPIILTDFQEKEINQIVNIYTQLQLIAKDALTQVCAKHLFQPNTFQCFAILKNDQLPTIKQNLTKFEMSLTLKNENEEDTTQTVEENSTCQVSSIFTNEDILTVFGQVLKLPDVQKIEQKSCFGYYNANLVLEKKDQGSIESQSDYDDQVQSSDNPQEEDVIPEEQQEVDISIKLMLEAQLRNDGSISYRSRIDILTAMSQLLQDAKGLEKLNEIFYKFDFDDKIVFCDEYKKFKSYQMSDYDIAEKIMNDKEYVKSFIKWKEKESEKQEIRQIQEAKDEKFLKIKTEQSALLYDQIKHTKFEQIIGMIQNVKNNVESGSTIKLFNEQESEKLRECKLQFDQFINAMEEHGNKVSEAKVKIYDAD